jgi:hypothetical protein
MTVQLAHANVVIVAKQFNPSIVNHLWLVENGLVERDEFRQGCVFTDMLANVTTANFILFAAPEQLQFTPLGDPDGHQELITRVLVRLVEILPHTPYTAVGMNFTWHILPEGAAFGEFARGLFFDRDRPLFRAFDTEDARFGGYLSKNELGCRLKLDVKPIVATANNEALELMQFAFNFHLDVPKDRNGVGAILALLNRWNEAREITSSIMQTVQEGNQ